MLLLLICGIILFATMLITGVLIVFKKIEDPSDLIYTMIVFGIIIILQLGGQAMGRKETRDKILELETVRQTIENGPKNQFENAGLMQVIINNNVWLAKEQRDNKSYWIHDLGIDDAVDNVKPLKLK